MKKTLSGFTLIELIIAVLIVSILAGIAIPAYRDYVKRGYLVNATNALASARAQMEQYYQDNRTYVGADKTTNGINGPCVSQTVGPSDAQFAIACSSDDDYASTYKITATGSGGVNNFSYSVDYQDTMKTESLPSGWGSYSGSTCWIVKKGQTC